MRSLVSAHHLYKAIAASKHDLLLVNISLF